MIFWNIVEHGAFYILGYSVVEHNILRHSVFGAEAFVPYRRSSVDFIAAYSLNISAADYRIDISLVIHNDRGFILNLLIVAAVIILIIQIQSAAGYIRILFQGIGYQEFKEILFDPVVRIDKSEILARHHIESGISCRGQAAVFLMYYFDAAVLLSPLVTHGRAIVR